MKRTIPMAMAALVLSACSGESGAETYDNTASDAAHEHAAPDGAEPEPAETVLPDLSALFSTTDAVRCSWLSEAGAKTLYEDSHSYTEDVIVDGGIVESARPVASGPLTLPGVPEPVTPRVIEPEGEYGGLYEIRLDLNGRWQGLTVTGMSYSMEPGTDWQFSSLFFAEPVEEVAAALGRAGFPVNADGSRRRARLENGMDRDMQYYDTDYQGTVSSISREGTETVFQCAETGWNEGDPL